MKPVYATCKPLIRAGQMHVSELTLCETGGHGPSSATSPHSFLGDDAIREIATGRARGARHGAHRNICVVRSISARNADATTQLCGPMDHETRSSPILHACLAPPADYLGARAAPDDPSTHAARSNTVSRFGELSTLFLSTHAVS